MVALVDSKGTIAATFRGGILPPSFNATGLSLDLLFRKNDLARLQNYIQKVLVKKTPDRTRARMYLNNQTFDMPVRFLPFDDDFVLGFSKRLF